MSLTTEYEYKPLIPYDERPPSKRWKSSQYKSKWRDVQQDNYLLNAAFMRLIERIKSLYKDSGIMVYERDQRNDSSLNPTIMHSFITNNLLLELECEYVQHRCELFYDFNNCPHEAKIRKWLCEYPFSISSVQKTPDGGIAEYFDRIRSFQDDKYFITL